MSEQCLELKNVSRTFHAFKLNNISFTLPKGYIMGLVGPNGAGKTTTIQLILNMLEKESGEILEMLACAFSHDANCSSWTSLQAGLTRLPVMNFWKSCKSI